MKPTATKTKRKTPAKIVDTAPVFPVVAIGASAGGLEAVTELLKHLSPKTGMAYIYVQHLSPDHKSMLTSLLSKVTTMKVQEVVNKIEMEPDNLYIIPPDKEINVTNGHIKLSPRPDSPRINLPINILFSSLAETHKANTIGVILSGSANDGTIGMKSIKQEGGITFAQDDSAKFQSMPLSAIAAGVVDFVLSPKEIAKELTRLSTHARSVKTGWIQRPEDSIDNNDADLKNILVQLQKSTTVDFSAYKMKTIKRRILRRMLMHKIKTLKEYAVYLNGTSEELNILHQDLLINVTSFFRDTDVHKYLKTSLLTKLLKEKKPGEALRIWVPACSTGEEAYSIAMMLLEIFDTINSQARIQIFATDLSEAAIKKARVGWYSKQELETVTPKRIQRFFTRNDGGYRISKMVRDICVFAQHNTLQDPPFSRLDFISCRNLFIYLDIPAQKRATTTFHYALKEKGYLMLGKSEAITSSTQLFVPYNAKFKVFLRKNNVGEYMLPFVSGRTPAAVTKQESGSKGAPERRNLLKRRVQISNYDLDRAIDEVLVAESMPASVVINHQMEILQFRGSTDLYLTHAPGKATFSILKMARLGINFALRNAIAKVIKTNQRERKDGIEVNVKDKIRVVSFEVVPLQINWEEPLLLIIFSEQEQVAAVNASGKSGKSSTLLKDRRIKKLEEELTVAHADALAFSQEQEAFIEELQSANEEIVSSNEELQTVNEELETSKEEIESTNEELTTSNQELQTRNDLLNESYEYSKAIISTLHEPMIVMDRNLRVKTANKSFYKVFGVKEDETEGMLLYDLGNGQWNIPRLRELMEDIVPKNNFFYDFEVRHVFPEIGEKVLQLNANKIYQKSLGEDLILLSINDITDLVLLQEKDKETLRKDIIDSKRSNLVLEKAVKERTRELKLANSVLADKNMELEKMNNELQAFTFVSSHDLQEPLRKIQTFVGRILETENSNLTDSGKNYFRYLQTSAERMQALILDLLTFSRINSTDRKFKNTKLSKIVNEVVADLQEEIQESKAIIEIKENCEVYIIPFLFRQVFHNLFSNALKFSKKKVPSHIVIDCHKVHSGEVMELHALPQGNYSHISVTDNGIGFKNEFKEKIFEVFQRLHSKDDYPGTGIGLAIVKKIVENHNGVISARSEINKGSTFDIYIPVK